MRVKNIRLAWFRGGADTVVERHARTVRDLDIWRTAQVLIDTHGDNAWVEAIKRVDSAMDDDRPEIAGVWRQVSRAVEQLQKMSSSGAVH